MRCLLGGALGGELIGLGHDLLDWANHVEGNLWQVIELTVEDHLEALDRLLEWNETADCASEHLSNLLQPK